MVGWWIAAGWGAVAHAEPAEPPVWQTTPYVRPVVAGGAVVIAGAVVPQLTGGVEGGVVRSLTRAPVLRWTSRGLATATVGTSTGSLGGRVRVGSWVGPAWSTVSLAAGPDLWFDGYGSPRAEDYWLPWAPGVDLPVLADWRLTRGLALGGRVAPGWSFDPRRRATGLAIVHQLAASAVAQVRWGGVGLAVGLERTWTSAGDIDAIILGFSL